MKELISQELVKFQEELSALDSAVKHIEKAGTVSNEVIDAVRGIHDKYTDHLQKIHSEHNSLLEKSYSDHKAQVVEVTSLLNTHKTQVAEVQEVLKKYLDLAESTTKLNEKIGSVDFPAQLGAMKKKLESSIPESFENTQMILLSTEKNLQEDMSGLATKLEAQDKKIKTLQLLVIVSIAAGVASSVLSLF